MKMGQRAVQGGNSVWRLQCFMCWGIGQHCVVFGEIVGVG